MELIDLYRTLMLILNITKNEDFRFDTNPSSSLWIDHEIVPHIISEIPPQVLHVEYHNATFEPGARLEWNEVNNKPENVKWDVENDNDYHTLLMIDPDVPSRQRPALRSWIHWLVVNIPGSNIDIGQEVVEFSSSGPHVQTGLHRFVFIAFKQSKQISPTVLPRLGKDSQLGRSRFDVAKFVERHGLNIVAANFFISEDGGNVGHHSNNPISKDGRYMDDANHGIDVDGSDESESDNSKGNSHEIIDNFNTGVSRDENKTYFNQNNTLLNENEYINETNRNELMSKWQEYLIVPNLLDKPPNEILEVQFNDKDVLMGNILSPKYLQNIPNVDWEEENHSFYTLVFVDLDATNRDNLNSTMIWKHWLVVNIPGDEFEKGETLAPFIGPNPDENTGFHRYVFLLYKQLGHSIFSGVPRTTGTSFYARPNFNIEKFVDDNDLKIIAGNFYRAQYTP